MATKSTKATEPNAANREESTDAPVIDSMGAAVKKLLQRGKERGFVTYDELNSALPPDEVSSEQIEDTMATLSELGINVVENEESEEAAAEDAKPETETALTTTTDEDEDLGRTDDPVRMYLREMGSVELLSRGRDRDRQTHRGRARAHDRRHLREPADGARADDLARRAGRGRDPAA